MLAIIGIVAISMSLFNNPSITGYVSGLNTTIYFQDINLTVDSSNSYTLVAEKNLHLSSFMISGEVIGSGRVEILLDNGNGQQYLVYENVVEKTRSKGFFPLTGIGAGITGKAAYSQTEINEQPSVFIAVQNKHPIKYEFLPLDYNHEAVEGVFVLECAETCDIPKDIFNSNTYGLFFRVEQGTELKITSIKYSLYE
jgi:hypothetical protein